MNKSTWKSQHTLNHVTVGIGSPWTSRKQKTFSPSVEENLSDGLMNFGSFPFATIGVDSCSQSWETRMRKCLQLRNKSEQQNRAINNARKGSWQGKERLREKSNGKTQERLLFCSVFLKVRRTYVHPEWSTHSALEFLASQNSPPNAHTHKRVTVFWRMELILFCSRMTCCRLDGSQRFPVGWIPTGIFETASRYFYNLFLRRTLAFRTLIMLVTYLTHS